MQHSDSIQSKGRTPFYKARRSSRQAQPWVGSSASFNLLLRQLCAAGIFHVSGSMVAVNFLLSNQQRLFVSAEDFKGSAYP